MMLSFTWYNRINGCSQYGDVRLVNGTGPYEGRVETCSGDVWKAVCGQHGDWWSFSEARVICAQLHYPPEGSYIHATCNCCISTGVDVRERSVELHTIAILET